MYQYIHVESIIIVDLITLTFIWPRAIQKMSAFGVY